MAEAATEKAVTKWAKQYGILPFKLKLDTNSGWPDHMYLLPKGIVAFIEFKRRGKEPRKLQTHRLTILHAYGYKVLVADDAKQAIQWLAAIHSPPISEKGDTIDVGATRRRAAITARPRKNQRKPRGG